jgi:hypothetical protein
VRITSFHICTIFHISLLRKPWVHRAVLFVSHSLSVYLWLHSPLLDLGRLFSFLILYTLGMTPWTGISPLQGHYLRAEQHKHRINANRHPCLEWDTNPWSQLRGSEDSSCLRPLGHCDRQPPTFYPHDNICCILIARLPTKPVFLRGNGKIYVTCKNNLHFYSIMWLHMERALMVNWLKVCQIISCIILIARLPIKPILLRRKEGNISSLHHWGHSLFAQHSVASSGTDIESKLDEILPDDIGAVTWTRGMTEGSTDTWVSNKVECLQDVKMVASYVQAIKNEKWWGWSSITFLRMIHCVVEMWI